MNAEDVEKKEEMTDEVKKIIVALNEVGWSPDFLSIKTDVRTGEPYKIEIHLIKFRRDDQEVE